MYVGWDRGRAPSCHLVCMPQTHVILACAKECRGRAYKGKRSYMCAHVGGGGATARFLLPSGVTPKPVWDCRHALYAPCSYIKVTLLWSQDADAFATHTDRAVDSSGPETGIPFPSCDSRIRVKEVAAGEAQTLDCSTRDKTVEALH
jgi:hypothetical protein